MKLTFNFQLKGLDGQPFKSDKDTAAKALAQLLASMNKGNSLKLWDWAQKLYNLKGIEIDDTDFAMLKGLIETTEILPVLSTAQLLNYLEEQKTKNDKK